MPLINILDLKEDIPQRIPPPAPAVSYSGSKHGIEVHVVRNGEPSTAVEHLGDRQGVRKDVRPITRVASHQ